MSTILIAEDEEDLRRELAEMLEQQGYTVLRAADGLAALELLQKHSVQLVLSDIKMPKLTGTDLMQQTRANWPDTAFVIMTAFGSLDTAIAAIRNGASDYLIKPLVIEEVLSKVGRIIENGELRSSNKLLKRDLDRKIGSLNMIGKSPALEKIRTLLQKVAPSRSPILITGESGTGKELIARAIHTLSTPTSEPFVPINCAAIPEALLESELFGHQKGAFTGAISDSEGLFRAARKGTLFLDEIGELPMSMQAKLLRALEEKQVHPVGSTRNYPFDARVLSATNRDLRKEIKDGKFREDLYFRLAVVELHSPTLRERIDDLPILTQHLIEKFNAELNRRFEGLEPDALKLLVSMPWKGNIRELQNVIERAMLIGTEPLLKKVDLASQPTPEPCVEANISILKDAVANFERMHVSGAVKRNGGDKRKAAEDLGISLASIYRYLDGTQSL